MGIRILRWQRWQKPCRGSRWTMRTATPGTRTGNSSICMWYMLTANIILSPPYSIFEKMNYFLSWSLGLPFSLFTWTLEMAFVILVTSKFGFMFEKIWIHVWKNEQLPVVVPLVAVLSVHLDPRHDICHIWKLEIQILIEKLAYKHVSYAYVKKMNTSLSWSLGLPFSLFTWNHDMAFVILVTPKFGFPLKIWHMNMYHMHVWITCCGPFGCRSHCSPGPSKGPLSHLKTLNSDSDWKHVSYAYYKVELLPVLVPGLAVLVVPSDPRYGLCHPWNLWIWIPLEKVAYEHV